MEHMNFEWRKTTKNDIKKFNNWHTKVLEAGKKDNASLVKKYLSDKEPLLGSTVLTLTDNLNSKYHTKSFTATFNGEPVGFVVCMVNQNLKSESKRLHIYGVTVNPDLVDNGVGTAMIFDIVKFREKFFDANINLVTTTIKNNNVYAKGAFSNVGFEKVKEENPKQKSITYYQLQTRKTSYYNNDELDEKMAETMKFVQENVKGK